MLSQSLVSRVGDGLRRKAVAGVGIGSPPDLDAGERLISEVSHELRTPLNVVYQFVTIVLDGLDGPLSVEQRSHLQTALDNVNQLRTVLGDLLDLTRIEKGVFGAEPEVVDVGRIVDGVVGALAPTADEREISLSARSEVDVPACWVDPVRFRQVLTNLLDNALKFTEPGGQVGVRIGPARDRADLLEVAVLDSGSGIPEDELEQIFDRLRQGSSGRRSAKGLGLGLYICRELVRCFGGEMSVESAEGRGSRFAFTVPLAMAARAVSSPEAEPEWRSAPLAALA